MRLEVAGVHITDAVVKILEDFQHSEDGVAVLNAIDRATRALILTGDDTSERPLLPLLQDLCWVRELIETLVAPPDVNSDEDIIPTATL